MQLLSNIIVFFPYPFLTLVPTEPPFFEQDLEDAWVVRYTQPVTLTCGAKVSGPESISFECNGQIMDPNRVEYSQQAIGPIEPGEVITTYASIGKNMCNLGGCRGVA